MEHKFDFYTQYSTFYLTSDNGKKALTPGMLTWSKEEYKERLMEVENTLIVTTGSYGHIRGVIRLLNNNQSVEVDYDKYDHIVETQLKVRSGKLQILDCPTSHIEFEKKIPPGVYGVRVYSSGLSTSDFSEEEGNDRYLIEVWPDNTVKRKVLKQYAGY